MHDRETLFRKIWENYTDRYGMVTLTQQELAKKLEMPYQRLSLIFSEYEALGRLVKSHRRFQLKDPDKFDWGDEFKQTVKSVRQS